MKAPFKMNYSPVKGKLGDFFKKVTKKATPETKAKRAEAKKTRKAGESQYQANVRTRREANRASKKTVANKKGTYTPTNNATKNKSTDKEITVKKSASNNYSYNTGENSNIKAPSATFGVNKSDQNKTKIKTKAQNSADKSVGVKKSDVNKKTKAYKGFKY